MKIDRAINLITGIANSPMNTLATTPMSVITNTTSMTIRLTKLILPKFRGDVTTWAMFWDSYKSPIHENRGLSTVDKFN